MRIVFFAQGMPDPCGAFFHDVILARALQAKGHSVTFVTTATKFPKRGVYRGLPFVHYEVSGRELETADLWSTPHNPMLPFVRKLNNTYEKPLVVNMHYGEDRQHIEKCVRHGNWAEFLWFVSDHIRQKVLDTITPAPSFKDMYTFRPTFIESDVRLYTAPQRPEGDCITLINANLLKGVGIFLDMAKRFPTKKFLGVKPYYNVIDVPNYPNVEWMTLQDDIRVVLAKTRILMVPSLYESWGRVAFEAMFNGIPVLYTKPVADATNYATGSTEGMRDWIGDNGIQCRRDSPDDWVAAINLLDSPSEYNKYSEKAYRCTEGLNLFSEIPTIEQKFLSYATQHPAPIKSKSAKMDSASFGVGQGPNRFMSGGMRRQMPVAQAAAPSADPAAAAPAVQRPAGLSFRGGRFGVRR